MLLHVYEEMDRQIDIITTARLVPLDLYYGAQPLAKHRMSGTHYPIAQGGWVMHLREISKNYVDIICITMRGCSDQAQDRLNYYCPCPSGSHLTCSF